MKEEEKYIQSLFEAAQEEEPQVSFKEVSETLSTTLNPVTGVVVKGWFFKYIYLNSIIALVSILTLSFFVFGDPSSEHNQTSAIPTLKNTSAIVSVEKASPITIKPAAPEPKEEKIESITPNKIKTKTNPTKEVNQVEPIIKQEPVKSEIFNKKSPIENTISNERPRIKLVQEESKIIVKEPKIEEIVKEAEVTEVVEKEKIIEATQHSTTNVGTPDTRTELEVILETALNDNELKDDLFVINADGELAQLLLLTNGEFSHLIDINFANKKAIVMKNAYDGSFNLLDDDYVDVVDFNVKRNTALLKFTYNSINVQINLIKTDDFWITKNIIREDDKEEHLTKEKLIQLALFHENMATVVDRDEDGNFKEFLLIANDFLSSKVNVEFDNKSIEVVLQKSNHKYNRRAVYAEIKKLQVKRKKAILEFSYKGKTNRINYRKKDGQWYIHSFKNA